MKVFNKIDYKGKYFTIEDKENLEMDEMGMDFVIGEITKEEAMKSSFVAEHKYNCTYYGIPCYIGDDKEMKEIYG